VLSGCKQDVSHTTVCGEVPGGVVAALRSYHPRYAGRGHPSGPELPANVLGQARAGRWSEKRPSERLPLSGAYRLRRPAAEPPVPRAAVTQSSGGSVGPLPACRSPVEAPWPGLDACGDGPWSATQRRAHGVRGAGRPVAPPRPIVRLWADGRSLPRSGSRWSPAPSDARESCRSVDRRPPKRRWRSGVALLRDRRGVSVERRSYSWEPPLVS
jgi:hypothetical protein